MRIKPTKKICKDCGKRCAFYSKRCSSCYHTSSRTPLQERIERFIIKKSNGCWEWIGAKSKGYGKIITTECKTLLVHRYLWEQVYGPIKGGLFLCHKCDFKACVNTVHMFTGTNRENILDARKKGIDVGTVKLTKDQVVEIRNSYRKGVIGSGYRSLGKRFNVSNPTIRRIVNRTGWTHI